ncbi:MAG: hypothetical protein IT446_10475 [Phycisphaerales bacterium]|nr:hypothetical protein [Phycisphaerales bacterium]
MIEATFDEILETIERWPADAQAELLNVIRQRLAERGRQRIIEEVLQGRGEFESGSAAQAGVDDLLREIES